MGTEAKIRVRKYRAKRKLAGLIEVRAWVPSDAAPEIRRRIKEMINDINDISDEARRN